MTKEEEQGGTKRQTRRRSAGPTVADVARRAGVSLMTVSRVTNRESNVLPATRSKVEQAIAELGYVPNPAARSLAGRRQCRIALLYGNPSAAYLSEFLGGALRGAAEAEAQLIVEHWSDGAPAPTLARRLKAHRIDAVLLPPPLCENAGLLAALNEAAIPVAQVATGSPCPSAHAVSISDHEAAQAMTALLLARGHRRVGFITGSPDQSASALRLSGYRGALSAAGIDTDPALVASGDYTYRSGLAAADRLLSLPQPPTAIFASNDDMAAAVLSVAHRRHLEVPRDLSVCGFDDTAMAVNVWPELTTVRQPIAEMSREAALLLAEAVRCGLGGKTLQARHRQLDHLIVERGSTAQTRAGD